MFCDRLGVLPLFFGFKRNKPRKHAALKEEIKEAIISAIKKKTFCGGLFYYWSNMI